MAKKNREAHAAPPSPEQTDSDSSDSSSEGEGSPSTPPPPPPPSAADKKPAPLKKPADPAAEKAPNSYSDSDDSDSPVKPIASKPIDDGSKLRKPRSKPNHKPSNPTPFTPKASAKRAAGEELKKPKTEDQKESKKPKTEKREGGGVEEEGKKSNMFQRLWSDEDEIVILKGMLEYKEKKGADPMADANDFHDFVKKSLHINFDRPQMVSKVRRLKKRYENSAGRKTFNAHETKALELSQKIWGNDLPSTKTKNNLKSPGKISKVAINGAGAGAAASSSWMKNTEQVDNSLEFIGKASISMGLDESVVKLGLRLCKEGRKAEIEEKWKQLHLEESKIFLKKLELAQEENKMIIEALKSEEK